MARHRHLVLYDIRDDQRLRRVCDVAKAYGYRLQYSVFVCDVNATEMIRLKWSLGAIIDHRVDSVALIDLGEVERVGVSAFSFLGHRTELPDTGATVI